MKGPRIRVVASLKNNQRGWLLQWYHYDGRLPRKHSNMSRLRYWFADRDEACQVRDAMRAGLSFEDALRPLLHR